MYLLFTFYPALFLKGFLLGASLIIAIGPQNAFVLRRGIQKKHVLAVASVCALADIILITIGCAGLATFIASNPLFVKIATGGGALFLLFYGFFSFRSCFKKQSLDPNAVTKDPNFKKTDTVWGSILLAIGFSLLNPHAILDTTILLGSISSKYEFIPRISFTIGAITASITWFFSLGYGATKLAPLFQKPSSWKVLDFIIGIIMWLIALMLLSHLL